MILSILILLAHIMCSILVLQTNCSGNWHESQEKSIIAAMPAGKHGIACWERHKACWDSWGILGSQPWWGFLTRWGLLWLVGRKGLDSSKHCLITSYMFGRIVDQILMEMYLMKIIAMKKIKFGKNFYFNQYSFKNAFVQWADCKRHSMYTW